MSNVLHPPHDNDPTRNAGNTGPEAFDIPIPEPGRQLTDDERMARAQAVIDLQSEMQEIAAGYGNVIHAAQKLSTQRRNGNNGTSDTPPLTPQQEIEAAHAKLDEQMRAKQAALAELLGTGGADLRDVDNIIQTSAGRAQKSYDRVHGRGDERGFLHTIGEGSARARGLSRGLRAHQSGIAPLMTPNPKTGELEEDAATLAQMAHDLATSQGEAWDATRSTASETHRGSADDIVAKQMTEVWQTAHQEYQQKLEGIDNRLHHVESGLHSLGLDELDPARLAQLEQTITAEHAQVANEINQMAIDDPERATRLEALVRQRYRLEARRITTGNQTGYVSAYTEDMGITVNGGRVTIYEDGSTSWSNQRHLANGEAWQTPEPRLRIEDVSFRNMEPQHLADTQAQAFSLWEQNRTPEEGDRAWNTTRALADHIEEDRLTPNLAELTTVNGAIRALQEEIAYLEHVTADAHIPEELQDQAGDTPDTLAHKQQQRQQFREQFETARQQRLEGNLQRLNTANMRRGDLLIDITAQRTKINELRYWQAFFEVNQDVVEVQTKQTRLRGTKQTHTMSERQASILQDAGVRWDNVGLNGANGNWIIYPGGATHALDGNGRVVATYNPNGTRR